MGGQLDRVKVIGLVNRPAAGAEVPSEEPAGNPAEDLQRSFATFEARNAKCFKSEDRERLLGVIEAGFGMLDDFDLLVRHLLSKRREAGVRERATGGETGAASTRMATARKAEPPIRV